MSNPVPQPLPVIDNAYAHLSVNIGLVYAVAYVGRKYLAINPLHAALFSLATFTASNIGAALAKYITARDGYTTLLGRAIQMSCGYMTPVLTVAGGIFSPLQAIVNLFLTNLGANIYGCVTRRSPYRLFA